MRKLYSWDDIELLVEILTKKIKSFDFKFNSISTVSRGGLTPSSLLSDRLSIFKILVDKDSIPKDSLFVDDIYDTGRTFEKIFAKAEMPDKLVYATLFARKGMHLPKQLIFAQLTEGDESIIFPWDRFEHGR